MDKLLLFVLLFLGTDLYSQQQFDEQAVADFQKDMNKHYADSTSSPLKKEDLKVFQSLDFFPASADFFVKATFIRTEKEKPFKMPTTTDRKPLYVKYGELHFTIKGTKCQLNVYQNIDLSKKPGYADYLFLPFTDLTSGVESYGGGRYIDLRMQEGEQWTINFNLAYNPYCAYNEIYSCPIPPQENDLKVEVKAGVKKFHD
jgi:uncharacterized protein (DUF1684 family)